MPRPSACPICRERHPARRRLHYDGFGVNSCGMYRARLATFPAYAREDGTADTLGPLFAMAPQLLDALKDQHDLMNEGKPCPIKRCRICRLMRRAYGRGNR